MGAAARFAHALIREALYEGTPPLRRRALAPPGGRGAGRHSRGPTPTRWPTTSSRRATPRAARGWSRAGERAQRAYAWLTRGRALRGGAGRCWTGATRPRRERGWLLLRLAAPACANRRPGARLRAPGRGRRGDRRRRRPRSSPALRACSAAGLIRCLAASRRGGASPRWRRASRRAGGACALRSRGRRWRAAALRCATRSATAAASLALASRPAPGADEERARAAQQILAAAPPRRASRPTSAELRPLGQGDGARGRGAWRLEASAAFGAALARYRAAGHLTSGGVTARRSRLRARAALPYPADRPGRAARAGGRGGAGRRGRAGSRPSAAARRVPRPRRCSSRGAGTRLARRAPRRPGARRRACGRSAAAHARPREQGDPRPAWALVRGVPARAGADTAPGDAQLPPRWCSQRLAARAGARRRATCQPPAPGWRRTTAGSPGAARCSARRRAQLGWAAYHRAAGDPAAARQHAERRPGPRHGAAPAARPPRRPPPARRTRHRRRASTPTRRPTSTRRWRWPTPAPRPTSAP